MLAFIKKCFFTGLAFLSTLTRIHLLNTVPLSCISMNNQEYKVRPQVINVNGMILFFFLLVLKQVNAVVVSTISIIRIQNCVFLIL